ncbi:MAG TPA: hypothetical protein VFQ22_10410 [Longimicrobiales bacterium]|nr:hypothetical protein [Longimicrobiales bacterium]
MTLPPLVGHEEIRESLRSAHLRGSLPAALALHGPRGVGKQRLALWLAQLLVCERGAEAPCGACASCRMALSLEHPDVHWYFPLPRPKAAGDKLVAALEEARLERLAELRADPLRASYSDELRGLYLGTVRSIRAVAHKRPVLARGPVFIVGEAELLAPQEASQEAANALLKLLEEPPGGARFILTSSEPGRLLPTIRSRTVPLHLAPLPRSVVASFLEEHASAAPQAAARAAALAHGSIGRALGFLPTEEGEGPLETLRREALRVVLAAVGRPSDGYALALGYPVAQARTLVDLLAFVEEWLRDLAAVAASAPDAVLHQDARAKLEACVRDTGLAAFDLSATFVPVERARELSYGNVNPQLVVSGLVRELRALLRPRAAGSAVA